MSGRRLRREGGGGARDQEYPDAYPHPAPRALASTTGWAAKQRGGDAIGSGRGMYRVTAAGLRATSQGAMGRWARRVRWWLASWCACPRKGPRARMACQSKGTASGSEEACQRYHTSLRNCLRGNCAGQGHHTSRLPHQRDRSGGRWGTRRLPHQSVGPIGVQMGMCMLPHQSKGPLASQMVMCGLPHQSKGLLVGQRVVHRLPHQSKGPRVRQRCMCTLPHTNPMDRR